MPAAAPQATPGRTSPSRGARIRAASARPGLSGAGPGLALGLVLGLLVLGPGLRRGFLLSYDMVFVPREPFTSAMFGLAGGAPRAVPSDFAVAVAARLLPADIVQKLVLLLIFMLSCSGAAALLDREPVLARLAAGVFYAWNPYVGERLIIGQWALLLGYAGLPWALRATLRPDLASRRGAGRLAVALLPAVIGGFAAMAITALVVGPVAARSRNGRTMAVALGALAVGSLPWLIPSLLRTMYADSAGVAAFAARADTPFGSLGSLLMLGGMWNADTVPRAYGGAWSVIWLAVVLAALAGYALLARRPARPEPGSRWPGSCWPGSRWPGSCWPGSRWPGLTAAALTGLVIACVGVTAPGRDLLRAAVGFWPGFAVLRDGQQFVAPLALAEAAGFGLAVSWAAQPTSFGLTRTATGAAPHPARPSTGAALHPARTDAPGRAIAVIALLAPVLLLPGLAWGAAGRLRPAWYPAGWLAAAQMIDASPARGAVLLLPWVADRTPSWNHGETMLDPWPRLLSRPVIWNDGTLVGSLRMAPDDPQARSLDGVIDGGGPLTGALEAAGVRFVVVDSGPAPGARLPGAVRLLTQPGLVVYQLPNSGHP